jgi:hypothetical protein
MAISLLLFVTESAAWPGWVQSGHFPAEQRRVPCVTVHTITIGPGYADLNCLQMYLPGALAPPGFVLMPYNREGPDELCCST